MCRLFGHRSQGASAVYRSLVSAENALQVQSQQHPDGWGIGWWSAGREAPDLVRSAGAAHAEAEFARQAELVVAGSVIAHIRKASVGPVALDNAHPFRWGPWLFAHNGTVSNFEEHRQAIEARIDSAFAQVVIGDTDSARCFGLFLTRLARLEDPALPLPLPTLARALAETVQIVGGITDPGAAVPSATTFLVGNGSLLLAFRRGRSLFYAATPAAGSQQGGLQQLAIASERISGEQAWIEVPLDSMIGVDAQMRLHRFTLAESLQQRDTSAA